MNVAVVAPTYLPSTRANTIQVMKMAQAIAGLGHETRLAAPGAPPPGAAGHWDSLAYHYGLQKEFHVEWLPAHPRLRRYDYAWRAVRWARSWSAQAFYTRLPQAGAIASLKGLPTILEVHDLPQGRLGPVFFRGFLKGRGARRLVVISRALAADLAQRFEIPGSRDFIVIAPDGVDLARYTGLPEPEAARARLLNSKKSGTNLLEKVISTGRFTAGYTGHLYAGRGIELILALARRLPDIAFLVVGGEPAEVARLQNVIAGRGLHNVLVTGFVANADLPVYQAACEVLLMPYQPQVVASSGGDIARYLSPMKLFEYLACGRAILSSDLPVLQEVLSPQNAVLLPPQEVDAWEAALEELRGNPARRARLAARARQDAGQYTWEARAARIFEDLLN